MVVQPVVAAASLSKETVLSLNDNIMRANGVGAMSMKGLSKPSRQYEHQFMLDYNLWSTTAERAGHNRFPLLPSRSSVGECCRAKHTQTPEKMRQDPKEVNSSGQAHIPILPEEWADAVHNWCQKNLCEHQSKESCRTRQHSWENVKRLCRPAVQKKKSRTLIV